MSADITCGHMTRTLEEKDILNAINNTISKLKKTLFFQPHSRSVAPHPN